jgi:hypothetical protein
MGHAWLASEQHVYDTNSNEVWSWKDYSAKYKAKVLVRYNRAQAIDVGTRHRHCGPWEEIPTG